MKTQLRSIPGTIKTRMSRVKIDKRVIMAMSLVGVLLVVAIINAGLNKNKTTNTAATSNSAAVFAAYRAERNLTRQREIEYLDSIIQNTETQADMLARAQGQKLELAHTMEIEVNIETVLKTKGLTDCVVSYKEDSISVMVNLPQLTTAQVAQVVEIIHDNTELTTSQIKIIPAT